MLACVLNTLLFLLELKTLQTIDFLKVIYFFKFIKHTAQHLILNHSNLLNTIPLTRTKTLVNNLLMSFKKATYNISYAFSKQ